MLLDPSVSGAVAELAEAGDRQQGVARNRHARSSFERLRTMGITPFAP
jgi:hypothetical protein